MSKSNRDEKLPSVRDLSDEERADVEAMLEEGNLPSVVSRELGIPIHAVSTLRRMQMAREEDKKRSIEKAAGPRTAAEPSLDLRSSFVRQIELTELEARLQKAKDDAAYEKEKRDLDLRLRRLELRQKERELEEEYGDDEPELVSDDGEPNLMGFLTALLKKGERPTAQTGTGSMPYAGHEAPAAPSPTTPPPPPLDVTKPLTDAQIEAEITAKATPEDVAKIQALPRAVLRSALEQRYPGITPENVEKVLERVKPVKRVPGKLP
jgi:hypothetical protein